jgi:hypothetical protein
LLDACLGIDGPDAEASMRDVAEILILVRDYVSPKK